jgi:hypothetical protein
MGLQPPTRNRYFFGELLDADDFTAEQSYHVGKRRLLNRLAIGSGILCGLDVAATADGKVEVTPGVAIDRAGREVVVPSPQDIDPHVLTDDAGRAVGRVQSGQVTLYLCYAESNSGGEPAPPPPGAEDRITEGFSVLVRKGRKPTPPTLSDRQREAIFPAQQPRGFDRRFAACEALECTCELPPDACVVLSTVTLLAGGKVQVDECSRRVQVYSNALLLELILSLAEHVHRLSAGGTRQVAHRRQ